MLIKWSSEIKTDELLSRKPEAKITIVIILMLKKYIFCFKKDFLGSFMVYRDINASTPLSVTLLILFVC
jgi:hypothetical protein